MKVYRFVYVIQYLLVELCVMPNASFSFLHSKLQEEQWPCLQYVAECYSAIDCTWSTCCTVYLLTLRLLMSYIYIWSS